MAISEGAFNKRVGEFLQQENNIDKATEVINQIINNRGKFLNINRNNNHPNPTRHHHNHDPSHNPHRR